MSESKESPCPDCGEMVRVNSLRCWNCGAFMNPKLEEKYLEMQAKPQQTIFSDLPDSEVSSLADDSSAEEGGDDDFELSMPSKAPAVSNDAGALPSDLNDPASTDPESKRSSEGSPVEATGDDILNIAMKDEKQLQKQRRKRAQRGGMKTPGGGLIIFCPYGCRIVVKESHRGMQGKCPECRAPFVVPVDPPNFRKEKTSDDSSGKAATTEAFEGWLSDLHLHNVNPEKLKLKADSLLKEFTLADFGFSEDQLVVAVYTKKARAALGKSDGKNDPRSALKAELQAGKKVENPDLAEKYTFSKDDLSQIKVVQPVASRADSIFHGITVFGEGRISIQLPHVEGKTEILYVSMGLTQFWEFQKLVEEKYGVTSLGAGAGIPSEHEYASYRCHFLETQIKALKNLEFYKADETVELEAVGYQCGKCQATVSEEGRKRESLGGKTAKGIPKAKCPKCSSKMGDNTLYGIKQEAEEPATAGAT